ncbi:pyridoxal phosphate-dependent aminotransferase [Niveibacterium umoris]|uniref:Methionine aminotransferase n=1 Tax=Niveibacterium umoris TaxID=1193620 RepID=A0A840BTJ1_9RHOO|nr:methionine aminotransferase [Niveibacterium umoris]MBB4014719.1 methionine aminotransferase [Niveibacterium umoris]
MDTPVPIDSRLPDVGTTIFTVMSRLAQQCGAINLSQGFPDFQPDPALAAAVGEAIAAGANQYPPMAGVPALREAIATKLQLEYGAAYDAESEITVTAGATQALFTAIAALVSPGDEVIVFEPAYDSYGPAVRLQGGVVRPVALLAPEWRPDWAAFRAALTPRTRLVIVNTPHNPTGSAWPREDMETLAALLDGSRVCVLADEVYEHMVFDGRRHESVARHPALAQRAIGVSSFGKTYHVTGWKVGYVFAPAALMAEFRKVHQFNVFTVNSPAQAAFASVAGRAETWRELAAFYQAKRDRLRSGLAASRLRLLPCAATYFQLVDYRAISDLPDVAFAEWLTREAGVAAIPISVFSHDRADRGIVRLCFAKQDATLDAAVARLVCL